MDKLGFKALIGGERSIEIKICQALLRIKYQNSKPRSLWQEEF